MLRAQTDLGERVLRLLTPLCRREPGVDLQRLLQDRPDLLARVERAVGILEDDLDGGAQLGGGRAVVGCDGHAVDRQLPARGQVDHRQHPGERRLPAARFADDGERLALGDVEARALDRLQLTGLAEQPAADLVDLREVARGDDRAHHAASALAGAFIG